MINYEVYQKIKRFQEKGISQRQIAEILSISKTTVNKYLKVSENRFHPSYEPVFRSSNFDIAQEFIKKALLYNPEITLTELFLLVKSRFPDIKGQRRAFHGYVNRLFERDLIKKG